MKKKLFSLLLCLALILSVGVVAYAAAGGFTMTYLPGTADAVTNMPANDSGEGGTPYAVSSTVPQRDGYVFLGWKLAWEEAAPIYTLTYHVAGDPNYNNALPGDSVTPDPVADIAEGGNVTLANAPTTAWTSLDGTDPATAKETYKVNYLEVGTDRVLAPEKVVNNQTIGTTVTEEAIDIDGYVLVGADTQDLTIKQSKTGKWTFTGWCSDEACTTPITEVTDITADTDVYGKWTYETIDLANNEITFYYEKQTVQTVSYIVRYIDMETNELLCPDVVRDNVERGTFVTEYAMEIDGYIPLDNEIPFEVVGDEVVLFLYYYDAPVNLMANAPMQATPSNAEPTLATPSDAEQTEAPALTTKPNVKVPATASEPQEAEPEPAAKETPALASEAVSKNDEEENVNEND